MSERDAPTPGQIDIVDVDVHAWVEAARADPVLYRARQVTEIVLASIGLSPTLHTSLILKGGALMALAFDSRRMTGDIDFTADTGPEDFAERMTAELNAQMPRTALKLGYLDLKCRVQRVEKRPRPQNFEQHRFPAIQMRIGSAARGPEEKRLALGQATHVVDVEVSFRDQVYSSRTLRLSEAGVAVRAFTLQEIIAEKFRALLQQPSRDRYRRQDIYDIAYLVEGRTLDAGDLMQILDILLKKCRSRDIEPSKGAIRNPEVIRRAAADWDTLRLELADLPDFAPRFELVAAFYESLPWSALV
jgi:predicted nucleotidyltransferase component of viral defense system